MKKNLSIIELAFAGTVFFTACNNDKSSTATTPSADTSSVMATDTSTVTSTETKDQLADNETYTCTMHNEVMSDHAGKCPKCEMDLVKQTMTDEQKKLKENGNYVKPKE